MSHARYAPTATLRRPIRTLENGLRFRVRANTHDDMIIEEVFKKRSYHDKAAYRPTDRWLDIGGHIGTFSVFAAPMVGSIVAYEPDADNAALLRENLALNGITNVTVRRAAVTGDRRGRRELFRSVDGRTSAHSLYVKRGREPTTVPAVHIADVVAEVRPTMIKMDCEGAEAEILPAFPVEAWPAVRELVMEYHVSMLHDRDLSIYRTLLALLERHFDHVDGPRHDSGAWVRFVHAWKGAGAATA